jgi:small-conductance mechanosensitive channel
MITLADVGTRLARVWSWLTMPFLTLGGSHFSAAELVSVVLAIAVVILLGRALRRALWQRILPRLHVEHGLAYAVSNMAFYVFASVGTVVVIQAAGINLTSLTVLVGALGVGAGFGLQEVAANFVSGLIILLERPIEVGDRIQVGELDGQVTRINMRATEVLTNDSVAVIVPNKNFITMQVVNWSRGGDTIRVHVPIGVAYGTNPELVRTALIEAAHSVPSVLRDPAPVVRLVGYGDSSVNFEVLAWTRELLQQRLELVSELNFAIGAALGRRDIQIPFPQRDLHVREAVPVTVVDREPRSQ